ncbi:MAG: nucleoside triphosphate pyrophosphohydrolase [Armatimonadetes bacterium]|nr:nucleoside triphosphate pyrophosphohydrolase [Armatimonadota bacterium]
MEALRRLRLQGPYQVHVSPVLLVPDERAHHVFEGFGDGLATIARTLLQRYPEWAPATVLRGHTRADLTLAEVADREWQNDDVLVLHAIRTDHPGGLYGLVWVVKRLLGPGGCPWDQAQTHESLKRHLIEEAYELLEAIDRQDDASMLEELGDVLLQPVMHAEMRSEAGGWDTDGVAKAVTDKLVRRHPHVFGDSEARDADAVLAQWDRIKAAEKGDEKPASILNGVPPSLPSLLRAYEVSKRAARAGFEWPDIGAVWDKVREEEAELAEAVERGEGVEDELGDLLFTLVNVARWLKVDPEDALRRMVDRFTLRFQAMEARSSVPLTELSPEAWDDLWNEVKRTSGN